MKIHQYRYSCVNTFVQKAGIKALEIDPAEMLTVYKSIVILLLGV